MFVIDLKEISSISNGKSKLISSSIDYESGIIHGVKEADYGLNKNGYWFTPELLHDLMEAGNNTNGIKCRFGHPSEFSESLGTYIGRKKNYRVVDNALFCDLHLDPICKETKVNGVSHWDWILKMAETNPDMFGNSVVFMPASVDITEIDGVEYPVPTLQEFRASDLVDDPAATNHLFNSETKNKMSNKIQSFFDDLSLKFNEALDKLSSKPIETIESDVEETLDTGIIVTIQTDETDVPKEGDKVTLEDGSEAPDGEHKTESGLTVTTEGGLITSIKETEEETTEDVPEETMETQFKTLQKDFIQFQEDTRGFMTLTSESFEKALSKIKETSDAQELAFNAKTKEQELAFNEMKEKFEASEEKYKTLASSIESPAADIVSKETLPKIESETRTERRARIRSERDKKES